MSLHTAVRRARALRQQHSIDEHQATHTATRMRLSTVPPQWFLEGTLLDNLADEHLETISGLVIGRPIAPSGSRTWATMCSGGEGCHFVFEALQKAYRKQGVDVTFTQAFACEIEEAKRQWIHSVVNGGKKSSDMICIFMDACDLHKPRAQCWTHGRECSVCTVDILVVGTSCKDMSKANAGRSSMGTVFMLTHSAGGSAQTFRAFLDYTSSHRPCLLLLENVDTMDDGAKEDNHVTNMEVLLSEMASRGYEGQCFLVDNPEFGLPARRRRYYVAFVRVVANPVLSFSDRPLDHMLRTIRLLLAAAQRQPPCAAELLLPDTDPAVEKELQARLARGERAGSSSSSWTETHLREFQGAGVRWGSSATDDFAHSVWFTTLLPRERDALKLYATKDKTCLMRNVSQSISRMSGSSVDEATGRHTAPAQLPTQVLWVAGNGHQGRLLLGRESLLYQGFPTAKIPAVINGTSESLMQDLAGNMMGLPVVLAILQSLFASVTWVNRTASAAPASSEDDTNSAVAAFERMLSKRPRNA